MSAYTYIYEREAGAYVLKLKLDLQDLVFVCSL